MTIPQWRDAPDQPGRWLAKDYGELTFESMAGIDAWRRFTSIMPRRFYGPIPPDPQQEQP